jgi:hypothetical protein
VLLAEQAVNGHQVVAALDHAPVSSHSSHAALEDATAVAVAAPVSVLVTTTDAEAHTAVAEELEGPATHVAVAAAEEAAPAVAAVAVVEVPQEVAPAPARVINLTGVWEKDLEVRLGAGRGGRRGGARAALQDGVLESEGGGQ